MPQRVRLNCAIGLLVILLAATALASPMRVAHVPAALAASSGPADLQYIYLPIISKEVAEVVVGAGDIADCTTHLDAATADLVGHIPGTVVTMGDNAYENGTTDEFKNCYDPNWGRFKNRTRPSPGNHDYNTANGAAYFSYFGSAAGDPNTGYYSYELSGWHVVVINSNCDAIGGCQAGSPQEQWLRADLAAHPAACTLAYWHHPRFSSGPHGSDTRSVAIWQALYDYHAEVALNGHDHDYERFAPQTPNGDLDRANGVREFVVGTGGRAFSAFGPARLPNSEASRGAVYGVIKLSLYPGSYYWEFVPVPGVNFHDAGDDRCH